MNTMTARAQYVRGTERLQDAALESPSFYTRAEVEEWMADFPKSVRFRVRVCNGVFYAETLIRLEADGANGGTNETGVKRYRAAMKAADRNGIFVGWEANYGNSVNDRETFEAAL